jgi:hypothetical protein
LAIAAKREMLIVMIALMRRSVEKFARQYGYDRRRRVRVEAGVAAVLCGPLGGVTVTVLDGSRYGVRVWCDEPRQTGTVAFIRFPQFGLMGFVQVRHCSACENGHLLGLAFREPLTRSLDAASNGYY